MYPAPYNKDVTGGLSTGNQTSVKQGGCWGNDHWIHFPCKVFLVVLYDRILVQFKHTYVVLLKHE